MSNNHKNSCQFAEQIVSYLYDEFEATEKIKFEAHLKDCRTCADEFAGFGFVRSSVLEWRDADFSKLAAPSFVIPTIEKENFAPAVSTESHSWVDEIRRMFSFSPALAATALAVTIVGFGIAFFAFNFSGSNEIAERPNDKELVRATVSPTVEITRKPEEKVADKSPEKSSPPSFVINNSPEETKRVKPIEPEKAVVKVSAIAPKNSANNSADAPRESSDKKPSPIKKQRVPNLNELGEDEDESIRLADLFNELDTK